MPLYEYRCGKCQGLTEVIQGYDDPPPKKCAKCGSSRLEKIVSRSGFVLKGSGWYQSDYKSTATSSSDSDSSSSSKDSTESKDSKPDKDTKPDKDSKPVKERKAPKTSKPAKDSSGD